MLKLVESCAPLESFKRRFPAYCSRYAAEDKFGFKLETCANLENVVRFLFEDYFKVRVAGLENIPREGGAILAGNHSGLISLDGLMLCVAACCLHPAQRRVRYLVDPWLSTIPWLWDLLRQSGQVAASLTNAVGLLDQGELVGIYPEGCQALSKTLSQRYKQLPYDPAFVQLAIYTRSPIIPVATIGGDEIYPNFINIGSLARLLGVPYFPTTLTFPWLPFPSMLIPLPVPWLISIGRPIDLDYPPEKAYDRALVARIANELQAQIQQDLDRLLCRRKSLFAGWDDPAL